MQTEIVITGFSGPEVFFAGQLLVCAAMYEGLHGMWIPAWDLELQGGTKHCTTIISDGELSSLVMGEPSAIITMNSWALDKYEPLIAPGGVLIVNSSLALQPDPHPPFTPTEIEGASAGGWLTVTPTMRHPKQSDIRVIEIPANTIAEELGLGTPVNLVLIGALLAATQVLSLDAIEQALINHLSEYHRELLDISRRALRRGAAFAAAIPN